MDSEAARAPLSILLLFLIALLAAPIIGVLGVSAVVSPDDIASGAVVLTPPCPAAAAGTPCATCGLTRSFAAMSRFQLGPAVAYNRAGPVLYAATWSMLFLVAWLFAHVLRTEVLPYVVRRSAPSGGRVA